MVEILRRCAWTRVKRVLGLAFAAAALAGVAPVTPAHAETPSKKGRIVATEQDAFFAVPLNTREANACSPKAPDEDWQGILIRAPQVIVLRRQAGAQPARATGPICGLYRIRLDRLAGGVPMLLKATDTASGKVYTGIVLDKDRGHDEPPPARRAIDPARLARMTTSSYFNLDLFEYLALPLRSATYVLHAEYGGLQSNAVTIGLREAP